LQFLLQFHQNSEKLKQTRTQFFLQIAESRETGAARTYAISLYEDVARVHGKNVVPHIPQVINALARSLLASGSSPQMHQTCAKVTAALSRYTIDSTTSTEDAEEILRELSQPLANLVSGLDFFSIPQAFAKFFDCFPLVFLVCRLGG
jgi:hypothetical protein